MPQPQIEKSEVVLNWIDKMNSNKKSPDTENICPLIDRALQCGTVESLCCAMLPHSSLDTERGQGS